MVEDSGSLGFHCGAKQDSKSSRTSTNSFSKKESSLSNGFQAMTQWDYHSLLYGSPRMNIKGYLNSRRISLDTLGLPYDVPIDDHPANMLYDFFYARHDYYEGKTLPFFNEESSQWISVPPVIKGNPKYVQRQLRKFKRLERWASQTSVPVVHLRLSIRAPNGMSAVQALAHMRTVPNRLLSFLQTVLPYRPKYVWCIEPTKRGMCHFHLLFFGSEWLVKKELLDSWWQSQNLGTSSGVWIERLRGGLETARKMVGYLIKYVTKPTRDPYWSGLVSMMGAREWSMSQRLWRQVQDWEIAQSEPSERPSSVLTCTNKTNSKWISLGLRDKLLVESIISLKPSIPPDELLHDLWEINYELKALRDSHQASNWRMSGAPSVG